MRLKNYLSNTQTDSESNGVNPVYLQCASVIPYKLSDMKFLKKENAINLLVILINTLVGIFVGYQFVIYPVAVTALIAIGTICYFAFYRITPDYSPTNLN